VQQKTGQTVKIRQIKCILCTITKWESVQMGAFRTSWCKVLSWGTCRRPMDQSMH